MGEDMYRILEDLSLDDNFKDLDDDIIYAIAQELLDDDFYRGDF